METQNLTTDLYKGGLNSSLDLFYAQVATLTARIDAAHTKTRVLKSRVDLIRSLGGGWDRGRLLSDDAIQPVDAVQYDHLEKPQPAGGIDVPAENNSLDNDLTKAGRQL